MATFSALPETLDLAFIQGDEFTLPLDFEENLTGYTFEAKLILVVEQQTLSSGAVVVTDYEDVVSFTQAPVSLAAGQINLVLSETQTNALTVGGKYRWYFRWTSGTGVTRTVRSGSVEVRTP